LVVFCGLAPAYALPGGYDDNGRNYLEGSSDLSSWSMGLYMAGRDRAILIDDVPYHMETGEMMGYVGYDITPRFTFYATGGSTRHSVRHPRVVTSSGMFGVGFKVNLLDHEIMDPTLLEDQIRLNLELQYSASSLEWYGEAKDYGEVSGSLTLGLVNDTMGNILYLPNGIGIFAGLVYSDYVTGDIDGESPAGYTAGLEIYYTEKVTIEVRVEVFDDPKYSAGIHLRL